MTLTDIAHALGAAADTAYDAGRSDIAAHINALIDNIETELGPDT